MYKNIVKAAENVGIPIVFKWEPFVCMHMPDGVKMIDHMREKWGEEAVTKCKYFCLNS